MTLETFVALPPVGAIGRRIVEQERTVEGVRAAATIKARPPLSEFPVPQLPDDLTGLLARLDRRLR
jgi:hypothetical protein